MNYRLTLWMAMVILLFSCKEKGNVVQNGQSNFAIDSLIVELNDFQKTEVLPGFAVSIFTKDTILFQEGFGYSNLKSKSPYSVDNVQIIASITKTLLGVAVMKLVEDGKLDLEDSINDIIPFKVKNPFYPNEKITIRHLATHTSTIGDTKNSDKGYRFEKPLELEKFSDDYIEILPLLNKTEKYSMSQFLEKKLTKNGEWHEKQVFLNERPGTKYEYSNLGIALLAYIIEIKKGESFDEFTEELLLNPLGMNSSTWKLEKAKNNNHITYYNEFYNEVPKYQIITYPDGGLYSSVSDMTRYIQEMMKGLEGESSIMTKKSYQEMMKKQFDGEELTEGICWDLSFEGLIGHAGNDFGTTTLMYFSPETGIGRILFTNISIEREEQEKIFYEIYNLLFKYDLTNKINR
ncbi:MAG: serine hydrolase domain-containing protein [Candidatus Paceibacterota bacterium]